MLFQGHWRRRVFTGNYRDFVLYRKLSRLSSKRTNIFWYFSLPVTPTFYFGFLPNLFYISIGGGRLHHQQPAIATRIAGTDSLCIKEAEALFSTSTSKL
jgi:hypothetical protein